MTFFYILRAEQRRQTESHSPCSIDFSVVDATEQSPEEREGSHICRSKEVWVVYNETQSTLVFLLFICKGNSLSIIQKCNKMIKKEN